MNLEECDRYCDQYEARLQRGERISAEEFVREQSLARDEQLLTELRRVEQEYRLKSAEPRPAVSPTPAPNSERSQKRSISAWIIGGLVVLLAGTVWALLEARAEVSRSQNEIEQIKAELLRLTEALDSEADRREEFQKLEQAVADLGKNLPTANDSKPGETRQALLRAMVRFWSQMIEADRQLSGLNGELSFWDRVGDSHPPDSEETGPRTDHYRIERAVCLARLGEHARAFEEGESLESEAVQMDRRRPELIRLYAICAAKAEGEPEKARIYTDTAIAHLRNAAEEALVPPPAAGDPELAALKSHPEFPALLESWRTNHVGKSP